MHERIKDEEVLLDFNEAASYLRISRSTLYRLMKAERLEGHKVGRKWVFFKGDLLGLLGTGSSGPGHKPRSED